MKRGIPDRALGSLLKVRRVAVTDAKAALAAALGEEETVAGVEAAAANLIGEEIEAASAESADDAAVEALAAWLPRARLRLAEAQKSLYAAEVTTATARAALRAARGAEAAVEGLIEAEAAKERAETDRQAHADLTEQVLLAAVRNRI